MIVGIGVDLVSIERIDRLWRRFGENFAKKILSENELEAFAKTNQPEKFLADHFAAKEAAVKALGIQFGQGITLHDIALKRDYMAKPYLEWLGKAKQLFSTKANYSHVSISDETDTAIAYVVLEY